MAGYRQDVHPQRTGRQPGRDEHRIFLIPHKRPVSAVHFEIVDNTSPDILLP